MVVVKFSVVGPVVNRVSVWGWWVWVWVWVCVFFLSPVAPTGEPAPQVLPFWTELIPELWSWTVAAAAAAAGILELEPYYLLPPVLFFLWPFLTYFYYCWFSKLSATNWFCFEKG
jgi:hypothetical protein